MLLIPSRKKLVIERDRLQAEIDLTARRNAENGVSPDQQVKELLPLTKKITEINSKLLTLSSKSDLIAERNALQS